MQGIKSENAGETNTRTKLLAFEELTKEEQALNSSVTETMAQDC